MRQIKFRAWDDDNKRMHSAKETVISFYGGMVVLECFRCEPDTPRGLNDKGINIEALKLMQFTELKDNKGIEIYEGDIVEIKDNIRSKDIVTTVQFSGSAFRLINKTYGIGRPIDEWKTKEIEIIGNIYENPELL